MPINLKVNLDDKEAQEKIERFHNRVWTKSNTVSKSFPGYPHKFPLRRLLLPNIL